MKYFNNGIVAVIAVLLVASLVGTAMSFTSPTEVATGRQVKVLNYQQEGAFDYVVTAKPAYFYDNVPVSSSESNLQIPINHIENMAIIYDYRAGSEAGESIEFNAILENPGAWYKIINLVPRDDCSDNFSVSFPLDLNYLRNLADTIDKEIGVNTLSHTLTIQANVTNESPSIDGLKHDFIQLLPITMTRSYIKMGDNLTYGQGGKIGKFDYRVKLGENTLFGPVTLQPTSNIPYTATRKLGPNDTVFTNVIENMTMNFSYHLSASKPITQTDVKVSIKAIAENPKKWTKTYLLLPETQQEDEFTVSFPLDLKQFSEVFDTVRQETGVQEGSQDLTLQATVDVLAKTDSGIIDTTFTQDIKTNLKDGVLIWSGDMQKSEPGTVDRTQVVMEPALMFGFPVLWLRTLSISATGLLLALFGLLLLRFRGSMNKQTDPIQVNNGKRKKYQNIIVEIKDWPELKPGQTVLPVDSFEDLLKVAEGLLKPVHHKGESKQHVYWVYDDANRYEYRVGNGHLSD